jgi:nitroreductase
MELKRVIGNRRTIRYYLPFRPVERSKIQKMLEAARRASCVGNVNNTKAVVIWKEQASEQLMKAITPPLGYQQMQTAPCFILFYNDTATYEIYTWIDSLLDLVDQRRIGDDVEMTKQVINSGLRAAFAATWKQAAESPLAYMDVGQAVAQSCSSCQRRPSPYASSPSATRPSPGRREGRPRRTRSKASSPK